MKKIYRERFELSWASFLVGELRGDPQAGSGSGHKATGESFRLKKKFNICPRSTCVSAFCQTKDSVTSNIRAKFSIFNCIL